MIKIENITEHDVIKCDSVEEAIRIVKLTKDRLNISVSIWFNDICLIHPIHGKQFPHGISTRRNKINSTEVV